MALNNSAHSSRFMHAGEVTRVGVPHWSCPAFAIPLIQARVDGNTTYVQVVDRKRKIIAFELFNEFSTTTQLSSSYPVAIGKREIFAVIDPDGVAHVGTRRALARKIKRWVRDIETPLTRMSFARFCDEPQVAIRAASEAISEKREMYQNEEEAIRWFINSVVMIDLFNSMSSGRPGRRVEANMADFYAEVHAIERNLVQISVPDNQFDFSFGKIPPQHHGLSEILTFARDATGYGVTVTEMKNGRPTIGVGVDGPADEFRFRLKNLSKQEERLGEVIKLLILDPGLAKNVLETYHDPAKFAQREIAFLLGQPGIGDSQSVTMNIVSAILPSIISSAYPLQRGRLLLALARTLKEFDPLKKIVLDSTMKSKSLSVATERSKILNELV